MRPLCCWSGDLETCSSGTKAGRHNALQPNVQAVHISGAPVVFSALHALCQRAADGRCFHWHVTMPTGGSCTDEDQTGRWYSASKLIVCVRGQRLRRHRNTRPSALPERVWASEPGTCWQHDRIAASSLSLKWQVSMLDRLLHNG